MTDNIHISRIRSNFLKTTSSLMEIWCRVEELSVNSSEGNVDQSMIDSFKVVLDSYDTSQEILKNSLQTLLVDILSGETESVDAVETKEGFEI